MQNMLISNNMEEQIKRQEQIKKVDKLHNRHLAKCLSRLNEINTAQIIIETVKKEFSYYTTDIKEQVLTSNSNDYDKSNTAR